MKKNVVIRNRYLFMLDFVGFIVAFLITMCLAVNPEQYLPFILRYKVPALVSAAVFWFVAIAFGVHRTMWQYCSVKDVKNLMQMSVTNVYSGVILFFGHLCIQGGVTAIQSQYVGLLKISLCFSFFASCAVVGVRVCAFMLHRYAKYKSIQSGNKMKKLLIVGAGSAATMMIHDLSRNENLCYDIVGLIDDDKMKKKCTISGYRVLGDRNCIVDICRDYSVDEILIAMPSASVSQQREVIKICNETECKIKTLPSVDQMIINEKMCMRDVEIDDLLEREEIKLENEGISQYIEGNTVLVTGGGGSIGSELCRQIMKFKPSKLVILDIYENNAYDVQMELNEKYPQNRPEVVIASVRETERLEKIFEKYMPAIVFHAAAHKHVPLMENSPQEAIKNNIFGTYNVAKCADKFGCRKFVMISTDKAVNPTNIMGASKRMCEMVVCAMQKNSRTEFVSVRFGNVLNSNGSVVPLFKRQIAKGGPVTVTHKDITRFFMTIPEAAQLVLQAGAYAKGGEVFVLDMGQPVKIYDLAKNLIKLSGYKPNVDIEIKEIGLRPGEKLYEELLMNEEGLVSTRHSKIFIGHQSDVTMEEVEKKLEKLEAAAKTQDKDVIRRALHDAVPTFVEANIVNENAMNA